MSVTVSTDIFCDGADCNEWIHGCCKGAEDIQEARRVAKVQGWKRVKRAGRLVDLCPECAGSGERAAAEE